MINATFNFSFGDNDRCKQVAEEQQPFSHNQACEATRYAGLVLYWIVLITQWNWLHLIMGHFAKAWRIFAVFLPMSGRNIRSIEQLKNVRKGRERI